MVDGLYSRNGFHPLRVWLVNVLISSVFALAGPVMRMAPASATAFKTAIVIFAGMSAADRIGLMVNMPRGIVGMQNQPLDLIRTEMEDPTFPTIDPDHGMIMRRGHRHGLG